jgi:hypothetical protein
MRLPVLAPAVIRDALHRPTVQVFRGLAPSTRYHGYIQSVDCQDQGQFFCRCDKTASWNHYTYTCCQPNQTCQYNTQSGMCECV